VLVGIYYIVINSKPYLIKKIIKYGNITDPLILSQLQTLSNADLKYILNGTSADIHPV
jgi:HKD family nuclease